MAHRLCVAAATVRRCGETFGRVCFESQFVGPFEVLGSPVSYRGWAAMTIADSRADRSQSVEKGIVQMAVGGQNPAIFCQRAAVCEIKRLTIEIGNSASGLFDDDRPGGLVPNPLAI